VDVGHKFYSQILDRSKALVRDKQSGMVVTNLLMIILKSGVSYLNKVSLKRHLILGSFLNTAQACLAATSSTKKKSFVTLTAGRTE
jgi:hypothetical protein